MESLNIQRDDSEMVFATGRTALELLAKPAEDFIDHTTVDDGRPLRSTRTSQRTFDQQANRPDSVQDVSQE